MKRIWKIIKEWLLCRYEIGFLDNTVDDIINGRPLNMKLMKHNFKDRWFADPFILEVTDNTIELLVEEYYYPEQKGRICLYIVDRKDYTLLSSTPVLSLDYHLSFPLIRREGDRVFVIPESENAGILNKYEYDREKRRLIYVETIAVNPVTDAVVTKLFGEEYMFCTRKPDTNGAVLHIMRKTIQEYEEYQTIDFGGRRIARMAGDFFVYNGDVYRPAQVCQKHYGEALLLQKVRYEDGRFSFVDKCLYRSPIKRWNYGFHTLNIYKGVIVVDCQGYRHCPTLSKQINTMLSRIVKIKNSYGNITCNRNDIQ